MSNTVSKASITDDATALEAGVVHEQGEKEVDFRISEADINELSLDQISERLTTIPMVEKVGVPVFNFHKIPEVLLANRIPFIKTYNREMFNVILPYVETYAKRLYSDNIVNKGIVKVFSGIGLDYPKEHSQEVFDQTKDFLGLYKIANAEGLDKGQEDYLNKFISALNKEQEEGSPLGQLIQNLLPTSTGIDDWSAMKDSANELMDMVISTMQFVVPKIKEEGSNLTMNYDDPALTVGMFISNSKRKFAYYVVDHEAKGQ